VPFAKAALHVPGQLIPLGLLLTVPDPLGVTLIWSIGSAVKVAVTELVAVIAIEQVLAPVHPPLQPVNA
jgi:hypothetical protein